MAMRALGPMTITATETHMHGTLPARVSGRRSKMIGSHAGEDRIVKFSVHVLGSTSPDRLVNHE
jgi:hypothetical protein